ncbi:MAG: flavodoxin family protein [Candidatus Saccharibacteria bacterium]
MKVLAINGSPREKGNTGTVLSTMLDVFAARGSWQTRMIHLNKLNMKGCQGCMSCKNKTDYCVTKDDMQELYEEIQSSDVVLLGSPVYFFDVTGQFKLFLDRCFAFWDRDYKPRMKSGKTAIFVLSQGQDNINIAKSVVAKYGPMFKSFGFSEGDDLILPSLNSRTAIEKHPDYLERARMMAEKYVWGYGGS